MVENSIFQIHQKTENKKEIEFGFSSSQNPGIKMSSGLYPFTYRLTTYDSLGFLCRSLPTLERWPLAIYVVLSEFF